MPSPRRSNSPWSYTAWLFGAILVLSIILSFGATVWRMEKTYNLVDSDIASPEDFQKMIASSIRWTRIGLYTGIPAATLYLISLVMHHRSKVHRGRHQAGERISGPDQSPSAPRGQSQDQGEDEWG